MGIKSTPFRPRAAWTTIPAAKYRITTPTALEIERQTERCRGRYRERERGAETNRERQIKR